MKPRESNLIGKQFKDDDGKLLQGPFYFTITDLTQPTGVLATFYHYKDGLIHGSPAIAYPDGQEEDWEMGNFVRISQVSFSER